MNRIESNWFSTNLHQTAFKKFFELVQNDSGTDFGMARIRSD